MYYAHFIMNKKGPLAKIWLAAHWDKKLTKAQIYETNIESTIDTILEPEMKLALRTSGHLLLGVCRIYSRKVKYLLADCNEAFVKIKLAFRPGLIDLPKEKQQANADAITLPEKFPEFFSNNFNDQININMEINMDTMDLSKNLTQQARVEDITLKEDFGTFAVGGSHNQAAQDDDFGDMGGMGSFGMEMDGMGMGMGDDMFMMGANDLTMEKGRHQPLALPENNNDDVDFFDDDVRHQTLTGNNKTATDDIENNQNQQEGNTTEQNQQEQMEADADEMAAPPGTSMLLNDLSDRPVMDDVEDQQLLDESTKNTESAGAVPTLFDEHPTINNNEKNDEEVVGHTDEDKAELAAVADLDADLAAEAARAESNKTLKQSKAQQRRNQRRKLIVDEVKEIDSATMKAQLSDTSGILSTLELAPPTRKLMELKEMGGVDRLFLMTARPLHPKCLQKFYHRNMMTRSLADITNNLKLKSKEKNNNIRNAEKQNNNDTQQTTEDESKGQSMLGVDEMSAVEASVHAEMSKMGGDNTTLGIQQGDQSTKVANDLDEFDQFAGGNDGNTGANLEDMLLDDFNGPPGLDITTPGINIDDDEMMNKTATSKRELSDDDEEEDDNDSEEEDHEDNKTNKTSNSSPGKSPNKRKNGSPSHKKKHRRSTNQNVTGSTRELMLDGDADSTLTADSLKNLNKRAKTMVSILNKSFAKADNVGFVELTKRNGRKNVVQKFYSLLVLKKYDIIDVHQQETYDDIIVSKGDKFDTFAPS